MQINSLEDRVIEHRAMSAATVSTPVSAPVPIPHRKVLRQWLLPISGRNTPLALALALGDLLLFALAVAGSVWLEHPVFKLLSGVLAGMFIARLFVIGHDACHQSLTPHRRLNRWLGRLVFLPSLTPYSLWDVGHNVVHHGYTNLRGFDFVWAPHTIEEFRRLPGWRRALERAYRSGWAPGLYYLIEMWWRRLYFPNRREMPTRRLVFTLDSLLVSVFAVSWIGAIVFAAQASNQPVWLLLITGFGLPLLVWNTVMGFVVYVHHTHPQIAWHADKAAWAAAQPFVSTTVHLRFPRLLGIDPGAVLHHILAHTAHHVDMSVPLYRLKRAQQVLEQRLPGQIVVQDFSWRWYFATARRCKLYDFETQRWTDFSGTPTSRA